MDGERQGRDIDDKVAAWQYAANDKQKHGYTSRIHLNSSHTMFLCSRFAPAAMSRLRHPF